MMSAAAPTLAVLRAAWQAPSNPKRWWIWLWIAGPLLSMPLFSLTLHKPVVTLACLLVMAWLTILLAWTLLVGNVFQQNHPTLARLLPKQVRRLRLALLLPFLGLSLAAQGLGLHWGWGGGGLVAVLNLCLMALVNRWPPLMGLPGCFALALPIWVHSRTSLLRSITDAGVWLGHGHGLGFALVLVGGAWLLASLIGDGGVAHEAWYAKTQARDKVLSAKSGGTQTWQTGWFQRRCSEAYGRSLAKLLARGDTSFERVALALGPGAHRSQTRAGVFVLGLIVLAVVLGLRFFGIVAQSDKSDLGLACSLLGLIGVQVAVITQLHGCMVQRQREQALVSLLPGVPRGAALNRALGLWLQRQYLVSWAVGMVLMTLLLGATPGTHPALLSFGFGSLACGLRLWGNWAHRPRMGPTMTLLHYLTAVLIAVAGSNAMETGLISMGGFVALMLVLLAPLTWWRWRAMVSAPTAWPVGRRC